LKKLTDLMLDTLCQQARESSRLRANHNLHEELSDPVQRLAIAMEPGTLVLPHRHPQTWEMLLPLRGRFVVLVFDDEGKVLERTVLGKECAVLELPANTWHAVLSLNQGGVIFEVKRGPYIPISEPDIAPWSSGLSSAVWHAWYTDARVGDKIL
jgi:cupin fold WbuC family metalloprotein